MRVTNADSENRHWVNVGTSGFIVPPEDAWDYFARAYDLTPIMDPRNDKLITNKVWTTQGCVFGQQTVVASLYDHTKKHVQETGYLLCVHRFVTGGSHGLTDDQPYSTPPWTIGFRDYSTPYKGVQMPGFSQGIYVVASHVGYNPSRHKGMLAYPEHTTFGRILNAEFDHFFGRFNEGATSVNAKRLQRLLACFSLACLGTDAPDDVRIRAREALRDTICTFIERHLDSPYLTMETILNEFGVSRATLYRMFQSDRGVRSYISDRRATRAVMELSTKATLRGQISRVAEKWGYSSLPNFNRTIKNMFGVSPKSLFGHPIGQNGPSGREPVFENFVRSHLSPPASNSATA